MHETRDPSHDSKKRAPCSTMTKKTERVVEKGASRGGEGPNWDKGLRKKKAKKTGIWRAIYLPSKRKRGREGWRTVVPL